jgi:eight-cysteine-cluster-containing protein
MSVRPALVTLACAVGATLVLACTPLKPQHDRRVTKDATSVEPGATATAAPGDGERVAAVPATSPNFDHFEGVAFRNTCSEDRECHVAGCSSEVCSADPEVTTTCEVYPDQPKAASCGCVRGQCIWYLTGAAAAAALEAQKAAPRPRAAADAGTAAVARDPEQGQPCPAGHCSPGLECLQYFGVGGPRGGTFTSCELRCGGGHPCPRDQECVTIADGPGQVCRPQKQP